ncbi:expressed unknown protein [Seminavis robusta]|uniref:Uncharacterized protein n=1 Tax=Seminavis robusta TaxID=568900 RepID=A0A9N8HIJ3_9STRA|nr:expressed unknown protein [Seminavis robusta]|eukprot:Sro788_g202610.1 n/a (235) ;mRNA; r:44579-45283
MQALDELESATHPTLREKVETARILTKGFDEQPKDYDNETIAILLHAYNHSDYNPWLQTSLVPLAEALKLSTFDTVRNLDIDGCYNLLVAFKKKWLICNPHCVAAVRSYLQDGTIVDSEFSTNNIHFSKEYNLETMHALLGIYLDLVPEDLTGMVRRTKNSSLPTWGNALPLVGYNNGAPAEPAPGSFAFGGAEIVPQWYGNQNFEEETCTDALLLPAEGDQNQAEPSTGPMDG